MRAGKIAAALLAFVLAALTAAAAFAAPLAPKVPDGQLLRNLPQVTVTAPKSGDKWMVGPGYNYHINWTYSGNTAAKFEIALLKGTAVVYKLPGEFSVDGSGKGGAGVTVPDSVPGGDGYRFEVTNKANGIKGASDAFALLSLKVTAPKGGEVWYKGHTYNITWTYSGNFEPKVYIWLTAADGLPLYKLGEAFVADKHYSWKIAADIERRKNYKIIINNNGSYPLGGTWTVFSGGLLTVAEFVK